AYWVPAGSGNWDVPANWSTGAVPTSATDVTISPAAAATINILSGESDTVNSVTLGSNATLSMSSPDYTNPTSNLLGNPDFESPVATNHTTLPTSWDTWLNPSGSGIAYLSTQYAYTRKQSFLVSGTNCGAIQYVPAIVGESYTVSVDAMTPGLTGNAQGYFDLYFYNSAYAQIGSSGGSTNILSSSSAAGGPLTGSVGALGWNHYYITAVAPASTVYAAALVTLWNPSGGGSVYFDDCELGPTATGSPSSLTAGSISNSGTIRVAPASTLTTSGALTQTSTSILDLGTIAGASTLTAASISNSGTILVGPASTATINGALTQTATGTFELGPADGGVASKLTAASVSNSGTLLVGPASKATIGGACVQASTGTLDLQLGGGPSSGNYGFVNVSGAATLAGTIKSDIVDGYAPSTTDAFTPMEFPSESGNFASQALPSGSGYQFAAAVTFTNVVISAAPSAATTATINASATLHAITTNLLGVNLVDWDGNTGTSETEAMETAAGLDMFRIPGGSASDGWHFNSSSGNPNLAQFLEAIDAVSGTGLVTTDYGSGSPQEAAAELAYVDGSPSDTTTIGTGIEWINGAWQDVNWQTVGYWASLRGAAKLKTDDGLNFLRLGRTNSAPFTGITYWEVGNEEYGSWEEDNHGTTGPGGVSTGAQHDPATYAAFASQFAALAEEIQTKAGLPMISIGIDGSGDSWTQNVLASGYTASNNYFVPGFISDHSYMQAPGAESDSYLLNGTVTNSGSMLDWNTRYAYYETSLNTTVGSAHAASVKIMATEYNSVYSDPGKQSTSLVNGLFVAESLGVLLDSNYVGGINWDLRNGYDTSENNSNLLYGWREGGDYGILGTGNSPPSTGTYVAYPDYFALQLGSKIIQSGGAVVSASSTYGDLYVYAVMEADGDLDLLVINTNAAAAITNRFDVLGFQPSGGAQVWQYGETQDTAQKNSSSGASALAHSTTALTLSGSDFSYTFPAYSMTVLDVTQAPTIVAPAAAAPSTVTGVSTTLSALGGYNGGESNLTYTWSATTLPAGAAAPTFSSNGNNAAKTTKATFTMAGSYVFTVKVTDPAGQTATSSVSVTVDQTPGSIALSPASASLDATATQQFTGVANDQFGNPLAVQPTLNWSLAGGGRIDGSGLYTPPYSNGSATVSATSDGLTGTASVTYSGQAQWAAAGDGSWDGNGDWEDSASQTILAAAPGVRGLIGDTALFFSSAAGSTVTLDGANPSLGGLTFNSADSGFTIASDAVMGGTLCLNNGTNSANIVVSAGSQTISAPLLLDSNVVVVPTAGSQLTISGPISGAGSSLTLEGGGKLILSGANGFNGGATVAAGTLILANPSALVANTSLTVGAGAALIFA
ncbi:MAG: beta strand repeat-containing protein, partial [Thermoguttaceae bacterium]